MANKTPKSETPNELSDADLEKISGGFTLNEELLAAKRAGKSSGIERSTTIGRSDKSETSKIVLFDETETI